MKQAPGLFGGGAKKVAAVASTGAAVVSILTFLNAWGLLGTPSAREGVANFGAKWIGIRPAADTARALYDTLHLAATVTDKNGAVIEGVRPTWTTENPYVADVLQDGSVIAKGAGSTTIIALIGELSARARVVVHQTVHRVHIEGDSAVAMAEGDRRTLEARGFDTRGYVIPQRPVRWLSQDSSVATIDSAGSVLAGDVGRAIVAVTIDGVSTQALVNVAPAPAAIAALKGGGQRGVPGATLPERVIVRVLNRRGRPVEGTLVRFRPTTEDGIVDPAAVVTDADGRARATWILGGRPGRQRIEATVERVDSALTLEAEVDPPPANTRLAALADTLGGVVGQLADGVAGIRLSDSTGRAYADVPVTWTTLDGGKVEALAERTDSLGEVKVSWTLGPKARAQRLRARIAGGASTTVVANAAAAAPAKLTLERARAKAADLKEVAIVATVKDTFGNVVPRVTLTLVPRAGAINSGTVESDSAGAASAVWTLAANPREQLLIATVKGATTSDTLVVQAPAPVATKTATKQPQVTTKQAGRPRRPR